MSVSVQLKSFGDSSLPPLVLVHGWGHSAAVWQPLLELLQSHFYIHLLSLPGYSDNQQQGCEQAGGETNNASGDDVSDAQAWQLDSVLEYFNQLPIGPAIWCGWSLGGMLATVYAARFAQRVTGLVTIASNAVFAQRENWPNAMPSADFEQFNAALAENSDVTVKRFLALISQGSETARADLRSLKSCLSNASPATLQASLTLLNALDCRDVIATLTQPQLHIFGEQDALVPVAASDSIARLNLQKSAHNDIEIIAGAGHAPLLSHPEKIAATLKTWAAR